MSRQRGAGDDRPVQGQRRDARHVRHAAQPGEIFTKKIKQILVVSGLFFRRRYASGCYAHNALRTRPHPFLPSLQTEAQERLLFNQQPILINPDGAAIEREAVPWQSTRSIPRAVAAAIIGNTNIAKMGPLNELFAVLGA